ncbi:vitellogenin-3 [Toxorhynchites rutilus septentrionalis]|uniref:vitellogenin-3 n=1 Tax=Toxorhynchites rutilus septentrionalis TaxID=329112 RepID=UPI0024795846|nr:vitellogenin-3 [Toxorhynchites rutilus septentrionalis]
MVSKIWWIVAIAFIVGPKSGDAFDIIPLNSEIVYRLETDVTLVPDFQARSNYIWTLAGQLRVQRYDLNNLAMKLDLDGIQFPDQSNVTALLEPFRVALANDSSVLSVLFKENEPIWSANIKRALASLLQAHGDGPGAYVVDEQGIFGSCPTEYFVVNKSNVFEISKTYDMGRCNIYPGAIYLTRSNIPLNICTATKQKQAITSRIANYKLKKVEPYRYMLLEMDGTMRTNVRTFESYYPQFLYTRVQLKYVSHRTIENAGQIFDVSQGMALLFSPILFVSPDAEATGGRCPNSKEKIVKKTADLLNTLADNLESIDSKLKEPYDETVSEIIRLMGTMDLDTLKLLFDEIDLGTSYRQETARNILLEIIPRTGTSPTILLTRDLIINQQVNPVTAVQLLISLPFYMAEPSYELVKECEVFLSFGADRPDIKHAAVLSYATMIYNTFVAGKMTADVFEKYVKIYFDMFLNSFEYEQQMLYLEALGNLQLENVAEYLDPIIKADYPQNTDIRFLAMWATMPTAHLRPNQVYETYWPIFHSKTSPLELRVAAFTMLLVSNPTPGRLLGLYLVIATENDPHMINFYRTTVLSISETTYPCYQHLKQLLAYMTRQLPKPPLSKYWVTGNYLFDYRDRKFHIGSMLQTLLIGSHKTDLPMMLYAKFDTEALGRFTGQLGFYIKARGLTDAVIHRLTKLNSSYLKMEQLTSILRSMKMPASNPVPLHFECIIQFEGKAVLSYHLNQTTFHNLTDGDLINRINFLLRDSHINMQIVRRPFMIKYALPTLIGTSADILIENTVLATIRGNTTQQMMMDKVARSNQVDLRYSSYAVVKIRSYNPIEDIEYSTIREQGFLVYIPINNEIVWDIASKSISYAFYRPKGLTSGISLKSRTRNTPSDALILPEKLEPKDEEIAGFGYTFDDLGIQFMARAHENYTKDNVMFMLETDVLDNAKVLSKAPFSLINHVLRMINLIQLNTIHIGRDKHLTLLVSNKQKTRLQGTLKWDVENYSKQPNVSENEIFRVNLILAHTIPKPEGSRDEVKVLHKWELTSQFTDYKSNSAAKFFFSLTRQEWNNTNWKLCLFADYQPLIFLKRPFSLIGHVAFNETRTPKRCPDLSQVSFNISYHLPKYVQDVYKNMDTGDADCPKEILRLTPPPFSGNCSAETFAPLTTVSELDASFKFAKLPSWITDLLHRLDHLASAVVPRRVQTLNITDHLDVSIKTPRWSSDTDITINGATMWIPTRYHYNEKLHHPKKNSIDYGFTSICSLVNNKLTTFHDQIIQLTPEIKHDYRLNDTFLLAADCSDQPKIAVFMLDNGKGIQIYTGGNYIVYETTSQQESDPILNINDEQLINLRNVVYQYPPNEEIYDFRVYLDDEDVLIVENQFNGAVVQYDRKSIVSILLPTVHKGRICGLCNNRLH